MKRAYSKVKAREEVAQTNASLSLGDEFTESTIETAPSNLELHPDRQAMLEEEQEEDLQTRRTGRISKPRGTWASIKQHRQKPSGYKKEMEAAVQRRAELEARSEARDARERDRRAMTKAKRPGKDGKVKLGRQGNVLLSRILRMTKEGKL